MQVVRSYITSEFDAVMPSLSLQNTLAPVFKEDSCTQEMPL